MSDPMNDAPIARPTSHKVVAALGFGALVAGAALLGVRSTKRGAWWRVLRKPSFQPPDSVFAPVWTGLYALIAYSGYRVWRAEPSTTRTAALALWGTQLALNAAWTPLFFGAHRPRLALADLGLLWATIGGYAWTAHQVDRPAALLMAPYLGWTTFAGALNAAVVRQNPWISG